MLSRAPTLPWRWLDVPVEQRVAIGELGVRHRIFRIELNCTFESFDRLAHTFRTAPGRIVTSGSVELTSFFVLARLRLRSRSQYRLRDRRNAGCAGFLLLGTVAVAALVLR